MALSKEINLLILGETGVGKSTFINSIANYLTYASLEEAEQNEMIYLITTHFSMVNNNYVQCRISIGEDKNEVDKVGSSATQGPKAYTFCYGEYLVRILDTPGIGDTRGYEIDKENTNKILKFISNLKDLHGICILLKPNNARLNVLFRFCVMELLTQLHKTATNNIVFCFTNARSCFYRPGDTLPALENLLKESNIPIPLSRQTMYCFDNESFRFLCVKHHGKQYGIEFTEAEHKDFSSSWMTSVAETRRMFDYIFSLKPHPIVNTLSLNEARKIIVNLTQPLGDISKNIQDNISVVEDKQKEIATTKLREEDLRKRLYIPVIDVERKTLDYPRTVCTSAKCVKVHLSPINNIPLTEYTTICHERCYLKGIQPEKYPHEGLRECSAMGANGCRECGCSYDVHTHLTYEQIRITRQVQDESIITSLNQKKADREIIADFIKNSNKRIEDLKNEQRFIIKTSAKFGLFLKSNAIAPYNDALAQYLDHQIREEKDRCTISKDSRTLERLEKNRKAYSEEVRIIEEAMKSGQNGEKIGPKEIKQMVKQLYTLEHSGPQIKQHMEQVLAAESHILQYNETSYTPPKVKQPGTTYIIWEKVSQTWKQIKGKLF